MIDNSGRTEVIFELSVISLLNSLFSKDTAVNLPLHEDEEMAVPVVKFTSLTNTGTNTGNELEWRGNLILGGESLEVWGRYTPDYSFGSILLTDEMIDSLQHG